MLISVQSRGISGCCEVTGKGRGIGGFITLGDNTIIYHGYGFIVHVDFNGGQSPLTPRQVGVLAGVSATWV